MLVVFIRRVLSVSPLWNGMSKVRVEHQSLSSCEDDPAEGAALNQVTQSISRFGQREGLRHDRFDRAGLEQRDDHVPSVSNGRLRLSEHVETPDAGLWHDEMCHVNGCLTACGIPECFEASS